ncbi:Peroxisome biogenesis protein 22 [Platanthera guangdongensis]|uniref:Peroxisome biogenesis protein 22 n=1 Tax=Platanthera guangdongensis TaxID=2320717 RepID=A0ABR2LQQ5_9ASPA
MANAIYIEFVFEILMIVACPLPPTDRIPSYFPSYFSITLVDAVSTLAITKIPVTSHPSASLKPPKHATVRPSVVEILLEIAKCCDFYLMERVLDDESEERVLSAMESAGLFVSGGLTRDKRFIRCQLYISSDDLGQIASNVITAASLEQYLSQLP